jgi:hypothetical protein
VIVAAGLRLRWQLRQPPPRVHRPKVRSPQPQAAPPTAARR